MIGERIKEERQRLGLNQTEFAALAGAAKRTQIDWEKGASSPTAEQLAAIAAAGADVQYVVTGVRSGTVPALDTAERLLLENYRRCTPDAQANLVQTSALLAAGLTGGATAGKNVTVTARGGSQAAGRDIRGPAPAKEKKERK